MVEHLQQIMMFLFWPLALLLALPVGYLLLLTLAAWFATDSTPGLNHNAQHRFVVLVPAHNEELLLPVLLENLNRLRYDKTCYQVCVVADNCTDRTAMLARSAGARVYERTAPDQRGKGVALQWLLEEIVADSVPFDSAIILDADSVVNHDFLTILAARATRGEQAIQAHYTVLNAERSWATSLRGSALAAIHYLRPQGRMVLGGSAGLKGNGMVFSRALLMKHRWSASVTEDIDYHMALMLAGQQVTFAPDAVVWAAMPGSLAGAKSQNVRWEQGRLETIRRYVPQLWRAARTAMAQGRWRQTTVLLDGIAEHLIPPFSILIGMTGVAFMLAWLSGATGARLTAGSLFLGELLYLVAGMALVGAPGAAYRALVYAPFFLIWKIWLYLRVLFGRERQGWVRTAREKA